MIKLLRLFAICSLAVLFASTAWAQHYTQIDYPDPAAIGTALTGGPNPQGTSVGFWYDSAFVYHGFTVTSNLVYTTFDPPGSTSTQPGFISPEGIIAGSYVDSSGVSHGFLLYRGNYTKIDVPSNSGYAGTALVAINPSGEMAGYACADAACSAGPFTSFVISKKGEFTFFDPPGTDNTSGSFASVINPSGAIVGAYWGTDRRLHGYLRYHGSFTTINYPGMPIRACSH